MLKDTMNRISKEPKVQIMAKAISEYCIKYIAEHIKAAGGNVNNMRATWYVSYGMDTNRTSKCAIYLLRKEGVAVSSVPRFYLNDYGLHNISNSETAEALIALIALTIVENINKYDFSKIQGFYSKIGANGPFRCTPDVDYRKGIVRTPKPYMNAGENLCLCYRLVAAVGYDYSELTNL